MDRFKRFKKLQGHAHGHGRVRCRMNSLSQKILICVYSVHLCPLLLLSPNLKKVPLRTVWVSGRCALFLLLSAMAPVAGAHPCVHYSESDSSDSGLAVKGKFATKHILMSSLFSWFTGFITGRDSLIFAFLSMVWGAMYTSLLCFLFTCPLYTLCYSTVQCTHLLSVSFLHVPYILYATVKSRDFFEHLKAAWGCRMKFLEGPGHCFCWWMMLEAV